MPFPPTVDNNGTLARDSQSSFFSHPARFEAYGTFPPPYLPPVIQPNPRIMSGYISTEEHERAMRQNVKLSQQLAQAREETVEAKREAGQAVRAFRKLAEWTYNERRRLLIQMTGEGESCRPHDLGSLQYMNQLDHAEILALGRAGTEIEYLNQQGQEQNVSISYTANETSSEIKAEDGSEQVSEYEPPEADRQSSIFEQVDELIAEEKGRLSLTAFRNKRLDVHPQC
jgi:hypothetical protein